MLRNYHRVLRTIQLRTFTLNINKTSNVPEPGQNVEVPPPPQSPEIPSKNPEEVPKIDRSRPLPPPAYAGTRLEHIKTPGEDKRQEITAQSERDKREVYEEMQTCKERDLATMRGLGLMDKDEPEKELEDHKRKWLS